MDNLILIHWLFKSLFLIHRHAGGQVDAAEGDVDLLQQLLVIQARVLGVLGVLGEYVSAARPPVVSCALFTCHMYPRFSKRHLGLGICAMRGPGAPRLRTPGDIPGCPRGRTVHVPGVDAGGVSRLARLHLALIWNQFIPTGQFYLCQPVPLHVSPDHAQNVGAPLKLGLETPLIVDPFPSKSTFTSNY